MGSLLRHFEGNTFIYVLFPLLTSQDPGVLLWLHRSDIRSLPSQGCPPPCHCVGNVGDPPQTPASARSGSLQNPVQTPLPLPLANHPRGVCNPPGERGGSSPSCCSCLTLCGSVRPYSDKGLEREGPISQLSPERALSFVLPLTQPFCFRFEFSTAGHPVTTPALTHDRQAILAGCLSSSFSFKF